MLRRMRFTQNPGTNRSSTTGTLPSPSSNATTAATVASLVCSPLTTSTSGTMCGGANQCAMSVSGRRRCGTTWNTSR